MAIYNPLSLREICLNYIRKTLLTYQFYVSWHSGHPFVKVLNIGRIEINFPPKYVLEGLNEIHRNRENFDLIVTSIAPRFGLFSIICHILLEEYDDNFYVILANLEEVWNSSPSRCNIILLGYIEEAYYRGDDELIKFVTDMAEEKGIEERLIFFYKLRGYIISNDEERVLAIIEDDGIELDFIPKLLFLAAQNSRVKIFRKLLQSYKDLHYTGELPHISGAVIVNHMKGPRKDMLYNVFIEVLREPWDWSILMQAIRTNWARTNIEIIKFLKNRGLFVDLNIHDILYEYMEDCLNHNNFAMLDFFLELLLSREDYEGKIVADYLRLIQKFPDYDVSYLLKILFEHVPIPSEESLEDIFLHEIPRRYWKNICTLLSTEYHAPLGY